MGSGAVISFRKVTFHLGILCLQELGALTQCDPKHRLWIKQKHILKVLLLSILHPQKNLVPQWLFQSQVSGVLAGGKFRWFPSFQSIIPHSLPWLLLSVESHLEDSPWPVRLTVVLWACLCVPGSNLQF